MNPQSTAAIPPGTTKVVYVTKQNAKALKTELERLDMLDKRFRMTPVIIGQNEDQEDSSAISVIAVPITLACHLVLAAHTGGGSTSSISEHALWLSLVEGTGDENMPLSTSQFAKKKKRR